MKLQLCAVTLGLMFCQIALAAPSTVSLGGAPTLGGGEYSTGGGITIAVEPRRTVDDQLALCGVWAQSDRLIAYVRRSGPSVLDRGSLAVNGRVVYRDLSFLNQVAPSKSYAKSEATCVGTSLPWQGNASVEIRIPRHVVVQDRDGSRDGIEIRFGPSEAANPALLSGSVLPSRFTSWKGTFRGN
ncbi:hypothetical protein [Roseovarius rhodophyticola]|uniref:Secreted protein n=1 Tax=Roseovarius rhodophyticola TaxID=3080827 RepID=A0ABZ2TC25_9RHOB|nr:hypothetical protein [Roseovarius sp. W115]MDV2930952.1 hypothetical protein [Roseovarius sp. W115]